MFEQARGDHDSAARDFKKATEIRDNNYQAWNNMGRCPAFFSFFSPGVRSVWVA
jgi:hypothetical protein